MISISELEKINNIKAGTVQSWKYTQPKLKDIIKICLYFKISPFWLIEGKGIFESLSVEEEIIIYILRHTNDSETQRIYKEIVHIAFKE